MIRKKRGGIPYTNHNNYWIVKAPKLMKDKLDEIIKVRLINGKDKRPQNYNRVLLAIARHDKFLNEVANADFVDDRRGQFSQMNIFSFIVIAFVAILFFAGLIYVMGLLNNVMIDVGNANEVNAGTHPYVNMTLAAQNTFGKVNDSIQNLRMVGFVYILGLAIVIMFSNSLIKIHPIFFFAYILVVILAVIFAAPISNAYQNLLLSNIFDGELANHTASNFLLLRLPTFVLIMGLMGGIFLFINLIRGGGEGELR